jgi:LmbE family N-acetylglucosaminyl deacetylase
MVAAFRSLARALERNFAGRRAYKWVVRQWIELPDLEAASELLNTMRFTVNLRPQELAGPRARRIAVLAPHPDDEVIGPGGTLIRARRDGAEIDVLYLPPRQGGDWGERRVEAEAVCGRLGFAPRFLAAQADLAEALATFRPDAVFLPFVLDDHPDHREASRLLSQAWPQSGGAGAEVWAYQVYTALLPNAIVDITPEIEEKKAAIRVYASQLRKRDWAHYAAGLGAFNSRLKQSSATPSFVEPFFVLPIEDYLAFCAKYFARIR